MGIIEFLSSNKDVVSLIIFAVCIVIFAMDKLPMATSAILGCAVMVLLGASDFGTAFGSFASSTVIMLIGVLVVGMAVDETGVARKVGEVITRASKGSERTLIAVSFVIAFLLSTFLTNVTVLAIFIPLVISIGKENNKINPMNIIIPITLAVNAGGISTLVGSSQQMTAQGLLEEYGYKTFGIFDFTPYGLAVGAVFLIYCLTIGYSIGKRVWGGREVTESDKVVAAEIKPLEKRKVISICIIFGLMVLFYITQKVPFTDIVVAPHITSTLAAIACIITGCISQDKAVKKLNWNIIGRLAACLGLAKVLQASGGIKIVADGFTKIIGTDASPFLIFAILVLFAQITSLFISNSTAISVTLLIAISLAPAMSLNIPAYAMGIVFGASMGCSSPLSGSTWGISMAAGYKFKDYLKYGPLVDLFGYIVVLVMIPLIMGLTV